MFSKDSILNSNYFRQFLCFLIFIFILIVIYLISDTLNNFYQSVADLKIIKADVKMLKDQIAFMNDVALSKRSEELWALDGIYLIKISVAVLLVVTLFLSIK